MIAENTSVSLPVEECTCTYKFPHAPGNVSFSYFTMQKIFLLADEDGDGNISKEEFLCALVG
jgi:hypothetical protein